MRFLQPRLTRSGAFPLRMRLPAACVLAAALLLSARAALGLGLAQTIPLGVVEGAEILDVHVLVGGALFRGDNPERFGIDVSLVEAQTDRDLGRTIVRIADTEWIPESITHTEGEIVIDWTEFNAFTESGNDVLVCTQIVQFEGGTVHYLGQRECNVVPPTIPL